MVKKCLRAWILGPTIKLFLIHLSDPKSINNEEFNQSNQPFTPFHYERSWTDRREPRHKTQREKACDLLLLMRHVVTKSIRKHTSRLNESKDPYLRSITYIHSHTYILMYVSKIFIFFTSANYRPIYLIDFINM